MMPDGTLVPWTQPARHADADRGGRAVDPVERPRLRAGAERPHARLRGHAADRRPRAVRRRQAVLVAGALRARASASGYYAPPGVDPDADLTRWFARSTPASRTTRPEARGIVDVLARYHSAYYIDHSRAPAPTVHRQRLDRRPVPGRRGAALLQPHARAAPGRAAVADVPRLRPPARPEQGRRRRRASTQRAYAWMDRYVKGDAARPPAGRRGADPDLPEHAPSGGPVTRADIRRSHPGEVRFASAAAQTVLRRRRPARGARHRPDRRRRRVRDDDAPPTSRAPRPTGCRRRPARATRCSARRR